jgi:chemotaxis protein MotB
LLFRKKNEIDDGEDLDRWLLTYADMITLLLAFFVVLYSISRIDLGKFDKMSDALNSVFKGKPGEEALPENISSNLIINQKLQQGDLIVLREQIDVISKQLELEAALKTELQARGLVIHISESAFFDLGRADLKPSAAKVLDLLVVQLRKIPNHIRVEGHTDNLPISTKRYPSNWELSTARATECLKYLIEKHAFAPERISAVGYAQYRPLESNQTSDGRAKNRRVDIVILNIEDSFLEPENMTNEPLEDISDTVFNTKLDQALNPEGE